MERLPKDVLLLMALEDMDVQSILRLCATNSKYKNIICDSQDFWRKKLIKDYPTINIQNVTDYRGLYFYLKRRAKVGSGIGDLTMNGRVRSYGGETFDFDKRNFSGLTFPKYPPEYFPDNNLDIHYDSVREIANNLHNGISSVTGPFGEKYTVMVIFKDISENMKQKIINAWKTTVSPSRFKFSNGMFYI